ncbi:vacuolar protein sorting-associated protein VTA1 [Pelomyxa schiedti]|nr:vacuolar protein sorting-associated protein VTA1 [Pelomyxa schiedti]
MAQQGVGSLPAQLQAVAPVLKRANVLATRDPVLAYYCMVYVLQLGIEKTSGARDEASQKTLLSWMVSVEQQKAQLESTLTQEGMGKEYVEQFALNVFQMADEEDRAGNATMRTAENFSSASYFLEVLSQFGPLSDDIVERVKYARWKAADIAKAIKMGLRPTPGPPGGDESMQGLPDESSTQQPVFLPVTPPQVNFFPDQMQPPAQSTIIPPSQGTFMNPSMPPKPTQPTSQPTSKPPTRTQPTKAPVTTTPAPVTPMVHYNPSMEDVEKAQKMCRHAASALDYEDVNNAVTNLVNALQLLTGTKIKL